MNLKTGLLAGTCVILAVVAAIGCTHGRAAQNAKQPVYGQTGYIQPATSQPGDYTTANPAYPNSAPPIPTGNSAYVSPQQPPPYDTGAAYAPAYNDGDGRPVEYRDSHHRRSTRKSV